MDLVLNFLRENPAWLFAAIAILPGFGVPSSPLLILAGLVWGPTWQACAIALAAVAINITWSHLLAAGPAKKLLSRILGINRGPGVSPAAPNTWRGRLARSLSHQHLSTTSRSHHLRLVTLIRFTPGVPLCVQNYGIGLLGAPLRLSLALAVPTTAIHVCGFVLTGGAIFDGRIGLFLLGFSLLIIATLAIHLIRSRIGAGSREQGKSY